VTHVLYPNFQAQSNGKTPYDHQTHISGPGEQCEGHPVGVQQKILLVMNIRMWHMFYTHLFKPNVIEKLP
jgi:hypothetical protein